MQPVLPPFLIARWLLLLLLIAGLYFLKGFIVPVLGALIIGLASWPAYKRLLQQLNGRSILAATIAILVVIGVIILPLSFALTFVIKEASSFVIWALAANRHGMPVPSWISELPGIGPRLSEYWQLYVGEPHALGALVEMVSGEHLGNIYRMVLSATGNVFHLILSLLFLLITLFFIYKDGDRILAQLDIVGERVLPLRWQRFSRVVPATVNSTVTGMTLIAIGEGVVLGLAYWVAGVPSPALLGAVTGFMALIPGGAPLSFTLVSLYLLAYWVAGVPSPALLGAVTGFMALIPGGAPLSFTLVSLYLLASGQVFAGVALFLWGAIELFIVDKTLRPRLVGGPVKLPFLPTFFGLVGGVQTMGMVGLFLGPVLMALLVAIWREWVYSGRQQLIANKL